MSAMTLILDRSGTAAAPDAATFASWAGDQRVFISSVMGDLAALRKRLAEAIDETSAEPVWFEDFGGRDDDAEIAYLDEVATSTIYLGVLGRNYGALDKRTWLSATHAEYREAQELGLQISVWVGDVDDMKRDQRDFLQEVRTFHTTGSFTDAEDLATRVVRRLRQMCAESVSPWVKLGAVVMRARAVVDNGTTIVVRASVHTPEVTAALEEMRPENFRASDQRLTWAGRSVPVRVSSVEVTMTSARASTVEVVLERLDSRGSSYSFSMGASLTTNGRTFTSEELAVLDVRHVLFGVEKPPGVFGLGGSFGEVLEDLPAQDLPSAVYQAVFSLVVTEALVRSGHAQRVDRALISPQGRDGRRVRLSWTPPASGGRRSGPVTVEDTMPPG
jgi:hypothetical protein